jgi:hypothetical protein
MTRLEERKWRRGRAKRVASARMHDRTQVICPAMKEGLSPEDGVIEKTEGGSEFVGRAAVLESLRDMWEYAMWCRPNDEASARRGYDGQSGQRDSTKLVIPTSAMPVPFNIFDVYLSTAGGEGSGDTSEIWVVVRRN